MQKYTSSDTFKRTIKEININKHTPEHIERWNWIGNEGKSYKEINSPNSGYRKTLFKEHGYQGNQSSIDHHLTYDITKVGMIQNSQTKISNTISKNLISFSENWESYLDDCRVEDNGKEYFRNRREHIAHEIFIRNLPKAFMNYLDTNKYTIKSSLGEGNTAGIPWLCIMHNQVTASVTDRFYIAYLFSRNAKRVYLCIGIGATQFSRIYGQSFNKCIPRIYSAKEKFLNSFEHYFKNEFPNYIEEKMDLFYSSDTEFTRSEFTHNPRFKVAAYEAGSLFTKSYTLNSALEENQLHNDLIKYINIYEKIIDDPISIPLIDNLAEIVYQKDDISKMQSYDYDIPPFKPTFKGNKEKSGSPKRSKTSKKYLYPKISSKKIGDAGEKHVYEYEYKKLVSFGRVDLANKIVQQHLDYSYYPGYDIQSFDENGNKIFIEVKSTNMKNVSVFIISENELKAAKKLKDSYFIYQVTEALSNPKIAKSIRNPIRYVDDELILLEPLSHRMII